MAVQTDPTTTSSTTDPGGSVRRGTALVRRDLLSARKDPMIIYLLLSSVLFAVGLRLFIGGFQQVGAAVVVTEADAAVLAGELDDYLTVHTAEDADAVRDRVEQFDNVAGVMRTSDGRWEVLLQGNEDEETRQLPGLVLSDIENDGRPTISTADVGRGREPVRDWIAVFYGLGALLTGGVIMGFAIIDDKEGRTLPALGVSPLSHAEYLAARCALVLLFSTAMLLVSLWVLGAAFDIWQVLSVVLLGLPVGLLVGFSVGALSGDTIAGIANLKFANLLVTVPGGLTFFIPDAAERLFYLLPQYWAFVAFRELLVEQGDWSDLLPVLAWLVATSALAVGVSFTWLRGRLASARS